MLAQEYAIGNYLQVPDCSLGITDFTRQQMVMLIEELVSLRNYKTDTLYVAVSLADKYLLILASK